MSFDLFDFNNIYAPLRYWYVLLCFVPFWESESDRVLSV